MVMRYARWVPENAGDLARDRMEAYLWGGEGIRAAL
jgi:hypothetical protein